MKRSWWRTGPSIKHTQPVVKPTGGQLLRQVGALFAVAMLWGGALLVLLGATRSSNVAFVADRSTPAPRATDTGAAAPSTSAATDTPTPETATAMPAPTSVAVTSISFQRDVQPIFNQICVKCHGGEEPKQGLVLKSYTDVMEGSNNGAVVMPGDPANSLLVDKITKGKMPKGGPKLLPKQIQAIIDWVAAGAPNN